MKTREQASTIAVLIPEFGEQHLPIAPRHLENMRRLKLFNQVKIFCMDEFDLVERPDTDDADELADDPADQ